MTTREKSDTRGGSGDDRAWRRSPAGPRISAEQGHPLLVDVALIPPIGSKGCLTYAVPPGLRSHPLTGRRVRVPLGGRTRTGVVVGASSARPAAAIREIAACLDPEPFLDGSLMRLCEWAARYYMGSMAEIVATVVPAHVPLAPRPRALRLARRLTATEEEMLQRRAPRQWTLYDALRKSEGATLDVAALARLPGAAEAGRRLRRAGIVEPTTGQPPPPRGSPERSPVAPGVDAAGRTPSLEQVRATDAIAAAIAAAHFQIFLLFGVTGSGKTDVYLAAADRAIAAGRSALLLVPEIGLTHGIAERARARFGSRVAVLHSGLAPRDRWAEWARVRRGDAVVVVGARSAVFAPMRDLGLVVVDEEHDPSYKQEEGVRYNGRDLAVVRARLAACPVILGSATPSVESFHHAHSGRYTLLDLSERALGRAMPAVELVDMRRRSAAPGGGPVVFSDELRAAIEANTRSGGQTLLFLNRRGFSGYLQCPACGTPASCPHCSVTLTLHLGRRALVCHHCGFSRSSRAPCERCGGSELQGFRAGTEQIEAALAGLFPALRVARMDRDSTGRRGAHERLLRGWHDGAIDVLVGTQMVTKGIDNPCVTLVGVLSADLSLNVPDFRAGERTFQLLGQVAGRAGRGDTPGTVLVQTLRPAHYSLRAAAAHDFAAFFAEEITNRQALGYPPFRRLINLRVEARDASAAERLARDLAARLRAHAGEGSDPDAIGPAPAPIERLRGWHRWQILVRGSRPGRLRTLVREGLDDVARQLRRGSVRLVVDVDPYSML